MTSASLFKVLPIVLVFTLKAAGGGPPCPNDRPFPVCAEFITPFFYNEQQWQADCFIDTSSTTLVAYNIPSSYNASIPDCGYPGYYTAACCSTSPNDNACSLAVDCDTQSSRPIPYAPSVMPTNWDILSTPCAVDNPPGSVFTDGVVTYTGGLLPYYCAFSCDEQGYKYAGVEMGDQCWCANELAPSLQSAPISEECNWPCQGGYTYSCGAYQRIQIFYKS